MFIRIWIAVCFPLIALSAMRAPALALPIFAHRYGVTCQACHTTIPHLNAFGQLFLANGFRWPGKQPPARVLPAAVKVNLLYTSAPDHGIPKGAVDEVELLTGGSLGQRVSYFLEQYAVDGGRPGATRDAWVDYQIGHLDLARGAAMHVRAGQFTLPLPFDPETERPTENHYAVFDQMVGANPFNFFDDRIGVDAAFGIADRGAFHVSLLKAHDPQSGLPTDGLDRMVAYQHATGDVTLSAYRYDGARPLGPIADRFWRLGFASHASRGHAAIDLLTQTGSDSSADGSGAALMSSGGFVQGTWTFTDALRGVVRYDRTATAGAQATSTTVSLIVRPYRNASFTIEDVISHAPQTTHTLNVGWLFAY